MTHASTNLAVEAAVNHNQWLSKYHSHRLLLEDMFFAAIRSHLLRRQLLYGKSTCVVDLRQFGLRFGLVGQSASFSG